MIIKAVFKAKPGQEKELEKAALAMVAHVQDEPGALVYSLHRSTKDPGCFFFYEKYAGQSAVDAHCATPYLQHFLKQLDDLVAEPPEIDFFEEIAGITR